MLLKSLPETKTINRSYIFQQKDCLALHGIRKLNGNAYTLIAAVIYQIRGVIKIFPGNQ